MKYDDALSSLYTFLQTTLYNIDIGRTDKTLRVKSKGVEQVVISLRCENVEVFPLCFILWHSFTLVHLKLIHGMYPGKNLRLKCGQIGCCLQFSSYSGFRRHLIKIHAPTDNTCVPHVAPSDHDPQQHNNSQCLNDETPSTSSQCQNIEAGPSVSTHSKDMCASIIAKLLGSGVPNTIVLSTIENLEEFVGLIFRTKYGTFSQPTVPPDQP